MKKDGLISSFHEMVSVINYKRLIEYQSKQPLEYLEENSNNISKVKTKKQNSQKKYDRRSRYDRSK